MLHAVTVTICTGDIVDDIGIMEDILINCSTPNSKTKQLIQTYCNKDKYKPLKIPDSETQQPKPQLSDHSFVNYRTILPRPDNALYKYEL